MRKRADIFRIMLMAAAVLLLAACASIGRPEGGPKDELPPVFVKSNPAPGSLNFKDDKLTIIFDENIKVEDVMNKVVVSPVQKTPPRVVANGKRLTVQFQDTLIPNATYTVDFSDAIRDLNENNILDGFAIDFSTGESRDSLVISGMLFEARNLEPAQGIIVGVYSNLEDSAITTLPLERIAKTNQYGQFVIRNLAPGTYNLFAINDVNRDYHWDRSENIAFFSTPIVPTVEQIEVTDTLRASNGMDSIVMRDGVRYLPNDVLLTWFNENYHSQYLRNSSRPDSSKVVFEFGAPSDTLPEFTLLNTELAGERLDKHTLLEHSALRDTLTYWINDKRLLRADTLMLAARYLKTDSLDQLSWTNDTLKIINKNKPKPQEKKKKKSDEEAADTLPKLTFMTFTPSVRSNHDIYEPIRFKASQPIDTIYSRGIHLEVLIDTLWVDLGNPKLERDSTHRLLDYTLHYNWQPGTRYRFKADSATIVGIYNEWTRGVTADFTTKNLDDYSTITFNMSGYEPGQKVIVELLNGSDNIVRTAPVENGKAIFRYLDPATFYARAYIDRNENGRWDTGNLASKLQPEDVYYFPKKLNLKKNWDIEQTWDINELPIDAQKPYEIKKNKPKTKDRNSKKQTDEDEEEEDDFYSPGGFGGNNSGNRGGFGGGGMGGGKRVGNGAALSTGSRNRF